MIAVLVASAIGFVVSLALFVVSAIKKTGQVKKWGTSSIVLFVVFVFLVSFSSGLDTGGNNEAVAGNSQDQQSASNTPTQQISSTPNEDIIGIDGVLEADCFDLTIENIIWTDALETSLGTVSPDDEGNALLCITFSAKNKTDTTRNVANAGFNAYVDGTKILPKVVVGSVDDAIVFVGAVSSGMEIVGYSVWELPEDWEVFQTSYIDSGTAIESDQVFVIHKTEVE